MDFGINKVSTEYLNKGSHSQKYPSGCSKPNCNGKRFIRHEDGWQCLNCMKIIYKHSPLPYIPNNHPDRVGPYDYKSSPEMKKYGSNNGYSDSLNLNRKDDSELCDVESITVIDNDIWDWAPDFNELLIISRINKSPPVE